MLQTKRGTLSHFSKMFKCKKNMQIHELTAKSFAFLIYFTTIKYNIFLYLLKVPKTQGTSDFRWLVYKFPCKNTLPRTSAKPLPVFQPCMLTFTSAAKDKSNNGDINHMTVSYQPGNEVMRQPEWL